MVPSCRVATTAAPEARKAITLCVTLMGSTVPGSQATAFPLSPQSCEGFRVVFSFLFSSSLLFFSFLFVSLCLAFFFNLCLHCSCVLELCLCFFLLFPVWLFLFRFLFSFLFPQTVYCWGTQFFLKMCPPCVSLCPGWCPAS